MVQDAVPGSHLSTIKVFKYHASLGFVSTKIINSFYFTSEEPQVSSSEDIVILPSSNTLLLLILLRLGRLAVLYFSATRYCN